MSDEMIDGRSWCDLPKELLDKIAKGLDTETDVLRFRAVCNSWRTSTAPFKKFPYQTLKLPYPFHPNSDHSLISNALFNNEVYYRDYFTIAERTVYRIEDPAGGKQPWLVRIERLGDGKMCILNPVCKRRIMLLPGIQMPKVFNPLEFRVSEVCKSYALKYVNPSLFDEYHFAKKVVFSHGFDNKDYVVVTLDGDNNLWYIKSGDDKWTLVSDDSDGSVGDYVEVVNFKGKFYGVNSWGCTFVFDPMFKRMCIANGMLHRATERHLMELNNGELYLIEVLSVDEACSLRRGCAFKDYRSFYVPKAAVEINFWRLDNQERECTEAKPLDDLILFVGDECSFSVPSKDFESCNGTRVFYSNHRIFFYTLDDSRPHELDDVKFDCCSWCQNVVRDNKRFAPSEDVRLMFQGLDGHNTGVCDFESGKMGSLLAFHEFASVFWPPPSWLSCA